MKIKIVQIIASLANLAIIILLIANIHTIQLTFWGIVSALTILITWIILLAINLSKLIDEFEH